MVSIIYPNNSFYQTEINPSHPHYVLLNHFFPFINRIHFNNLWQVKHSLPLLVSFIRTANNSSLPFFLHLLFYIHPSNNSLISISNDESFIIYSLSLNKILLKHQTPFKTPTSLTQLFLRMAEQWQCLITTVK